MTPDDWECEECGQEPATTLIDLDGQPTWMCAGCALWWDNHASSGGATGGS